MSFIEILKVLVLGIVEGFTEWLPISSTGHLILVDKIVQFKQPEEFVNMFKVVIQLGAILAVLVMYFHRLNPFSKRKKTVPAAGDPAALDEDSGGLPAGGGVRPAAGRLD